MKPRQTLIGNSDMSINKAELIQRAATHSGLNLQTVGLAFDAVLEEIYTSLKQGESVSLRDFGTFYSNPK
jgi:DNA-binding protein HU-beta